MKLQDAENKAREYFNGNEKYFKVLSYMPLEEHCIVEFVDKPNENILYAAFNEQGRANNVFYDSFDKCVISTLLGLRINDDKVLNMIMSVKR